MEALDLFRRAAANNSARRVGLRTEQPRLTVAQHRVAQQESDILSLPHDLSYWLPLQDSGGNFFLMADFDAEGAPGRVVR